MKGIWINTAGQIAQQQKVDIHANNIANINTPGFKKDDIVFEEYLTALKNPPTDINLPSKEWSPKDFYHTQGQEAAYVHSQNSYADLSQGQIIPTENPFDLALNGKGFFGVQTPQGQRYTRLGQFSLDAQKRIVTSQGYPIDVSAVIDGPPSTAIQIDPNAVLHIDEKGELFQKGKSLGFIKIYHFNRPEKLRKEGEALWLNPEEGNANTFNPAAEGNNKQLTYVKQGHLENSNVNPISEMAELIKAQRNFESLQKAINAYDQINAKAVNDISKF